MKFFVAVVVAFFAFTVYGGGVVDAADGPTSIRDSNIGNIINIIINVNGVFSNRIDGDIVKIVVGVLNQIGEYDISEAQVMEELNKYKAKHEKLLGKAN
jgi:hypothetical protein